LILRALTNLPAFIVVPSRKPKKDPSQPSIAFHGTIGRSETSQRRPPFVFSLKRLQLFSIEVRCHCRLFFDVRVVDNTLDAHRYHKACRFFVCMPPVELLETAPASVSASTVRHAWMYSTLVLVPDAWKQTLSSTGVHLPPSLEPPHRATYGRYQLCPLEKIRNKTKLTTLCSHFTTSSLFLVGCRIALHLFTDQIIIR
jgi:hypothetical protein